MRPTFLKHVDGGRLLFDALAVLAVALASAAVRSCNSPSTRAFTIAITARAAKFSNRPICLSENARTSCR